MTRTEGVVRGRRRLHPAAVAGAAAVAVAAAGAGLAIGPSPIGPLDALAEVASRLPGSPVRSPLGPTQAAIVWEIRLPRVALASLVGAVLALSGGAYQGVFRNPLADPYLLGVAAGAGLGATVAIAAGGAGGGPLGPVPAAAFAGSLAAVALTYLLGAAGDRRRSPASLLLAGVAVASGLTAVQTFVQQRESEVIREVYSWVLGRLTTASWADVAVVVPYAVVASAVILRRRRALDVLAVGDDEAASLGLPVEAVRVQVVVAASLATAAAVSVSGLIGFVGLVVPHTIRLLGGASYRVILPLSLLLGAAFLTLADVAARTALAPAEVPIGVVTALVGAPFFALVLRARRPVPT